MNSTLYSVSLSRLFGLLGRVGSGLLLSSGLLVSHSLWVQAQAAPGQSSSSSSSVSSSLAVPAQAQAGSKSESNSGTIKSKSASKTPDSALAKIPANAPLTQEEKDSPVEQARRYNSVSNYARAIAVLKGNIASNTKKDVHITVSDWREDSTGQNLALRELTNDQLRDIHYSDVYNLLGLTYTAIGRGSDAEASLLKAISLNPQNGVALSNLSAVYFKLQRIDDSIALANRALKVSDRFIEAYITLGKAYRAKGKYDLEQKQVEAYNRFRKISLAETFNRSNLSRAKYMYSLVSQKPPSAKRSVALGVINQQFHDYAASEQCFLNAIKLDGKLVEAHWAYGLMLSGQKRYNDAIKQYSQAISLDPKYAMAYFHRGQSYCELKKNNEAIADFSKCLELGPATPTVAALSYWGRATSQGNLKQYAAAVKDLNKVLTFKLSPGIKAHVLSDRGALYEGLGNKTQALKDYEAGMEIAPDSKVINAQRGKLMLSMGEYEQATIDIGKSKSTEVTDVSKEPPSAADLKAQIEHYDKLIKMFPKTAIDSLYNRGLLYLTSGDAVKAGNDMQAVVTHTKEANSTADYAACFGSIALRMQKKNAEADVLLKDYAKKPRHEPEPMEVRYFLNKARALGPVNIEVNDTKKKTRVLTLVGLDAIARGNKPLAARLLSSVRNTGDPSMDEYALAVSALKRLDAK